MVFPDSLAAYRKRKAAQNQMPTPEPKEEGHRQSIKNNREPDAVRPCHVPHDTGDLTSEPTLLAPDHSLSPVS